jgi:hypothetical protein
MNYSSLTKTMLVILVVGLCFAVFDAVAGPCYKNTESETYLSILKTGFLPQTVSEKSRGLVIGRLDFLSWL